jgi:hypothetical protein
LVWNSYYRNRKLSQSARFVGSFWWKDILKLCDLFRGIAGCTINDGKTILFWHDLWNEKVRKDSYPRLYSFARDKNINITAANFILREDLTSNFHLPLSEWAFEEFQILITEIENLQTHLTDSQEKRCLDLHLGK